jgi:hypothetical protein
MSTAASMTASSGTVPNISDGHATTPVSIETAASKAAPEKTSPSMAYIWCCPSVLTFLLIRSICSSEAHSAIPDNTLSRRSSSTAVRNTLSSPIRSARRSPVRVWCGIFPRLSIAIAMRSTRAGQWLYSVVLE